jgi:hypothetical protein
MNYSVTRNTTPLIRGGVVMLRLCYGCYVTVTLIVSYVCSLRHGVTTKRLIVTPGLLRFLENNVNCNARLALDYGLITNESSGFIVL